MPFGQTHGGLGKLNLFLIIVSVGRAATNPLVHMYYYLEVNDTVLI